MKLPDHFVAEARRADAQPDEMQRQEAWATLNERIRDHFKVPQNRFFTIHCWNWSISIDPTRTREVPVKKISKSDQP